MFNALNFAVGGDGPPTSFLHKLPEACNQPFSLTGTHTCKFNFGKNTSALAHNVDNGAMWTEPEQPKLFSLQVSSGNGGDDEMTDSCQFGLFLHPTITQYYNFPWLPLGPGTSLIHFASRYEPPSAREK